MYVGRRSEKKSVQETEVKTVDDKLTHESTSTAEHKESRDVMTSSDLKRGDRDDNEVALPPAESPWRDTTAETDALASTSLEDGTSSLGTDRKENSDKPERKTTASMGAPPQALLYISVGQAGWQYAVLLAHL